MMAKNIASVARDYAMLERNILAHFKLVLLLSLSFSSLLLHARLPSPTASVAKLLGASFPLALILFIGGMAIVFIGCWDYISNFTDMINSKGFFVATDARFLTMAFITAVIFAVCVVILVQHS